MPNPDGAAATRHARFRTLFDEQHRALLAYAARRTPTLADAEDAVAEAFLIAWRRLDRVPESGAARLWLYAVVRRTVSNQRRGDARRHRLVGRLEATWTPPADGETSRPEVLDALARLPAADQELLRLVAWEELTHTEIAQVLDISPNAVAIRVHRARRRLEDQLGIEAAGSAKGSRRWRTFTFSKGRQR